MIIIETDKKYQGFGRFFDRVGNKKFKRVWAGWVAVTWTQFDLKGMHDYISAGNTIWKREK